MTAAAFLCAAAFVSAQSGDKFGEPQPENWRRWDVPSAPALSAEEQRATFDLPPGFRIELVAAEPLVRDPVAIQWDARGRLWVVEMSGFMNDADGTGELEPSGAVVILEDEDGDGRMDRRTVFRDQLVLPRAVSVVEGGALVLAAPVLMFLADEDDDGRADGKRILARGYEAGLHNPEHEANGYRWGLDNWLYAAKDPLRFRFVDGEMRTGRGIGAGQWGIAEDDWGRHYYNTNSFPLYADFVPAHYLGRNPNLGRAFGGTMRVDRSGTTWPARMTPGVNRGYRSGTLRDDGRLRTWTAACGPVVYRGDWFPPNLVGDAFLCEPAGNFVHHCAIEDRDGDLTGTNPWGRDEFLTSTDERFRPVNLANGPDGALYVVDFYAGILQHRVYLTTYLRKQIEERGLDEPDDLGRIWRVRPVAEREALEPPVLHDASETELVAALAHPNGWRRQTAQRLLVQRGFSDEAAALLEGMVTDGPSPQSRVHALWTLHGRGISDSRAIGVALRDPHPQVVVHALRVSEERSHEPGIWEAWRSAAKRPEREIARQLVLGLGESRHEDALPLLAGVLKRRADDRVLREGAVSSVAGRELELLRLLLAEEAPWPNPQAAEATLALLAACVSREGDGARISDLIALAQVAAPPWEAALLQGLGEAAAGSDAAVAALDDLPEDHRASVLRGREVYRGLCAACHQKDGEGIPGLAPPLAGSEWLDLPDAELARIVLRGLDGPIEVAGESYDLVMPPMRGLSDAEIADALTWARWAWGSDQDPVPFQAVAEERKRTDAPPPSPGEGD